MKAAVPETSDALQSLTAEDLQQMPDEKKYELVDSRLVERQMSGLSSEVAVRLSHELLKEVLPRQLGSVFGADCGYQCFSFDPERVRRPDVSFISRGRLSDEQRQRGYITIVPDLVAEVVSPNDLYHDVVEKVAEYITAGVKLVWVIDPVALNANVHRPDGSDTRVEQDDVLSGEEVIPGFQCQLKALLPDRAGA